LRVDRAAQSNPSRRRNNIKSGTKYLQRWILQQAVNGVWALSPGNVSPNNSDAAAAPAAQIYFTAGPNHGSGGLLGYLTSVSTELTKGNDQ